MSTVTILRNGQSVEVDVESVYGPPPTLEQRKAALIEQLRAAFRNARDSGTTIDLGTGLIRIATDDQATASVERLHGDLLRRQANGEVNPTQDFATSEYAVVEGCTIAMAAAILEAVAAHHRQVWANDAAHGKAIKAAGDDAALDIVDIATGWPA
jgi:hypothetical protein